jgi:hypothetical protein
MNWSVGRALNTEANVSIPADTADPTTLSSRRSGPVIQRGFWGANYPRLLDIKRSRDPAGVLRVHHGADSEEP